MRRRCLLDGVDSYRINQGWLDYRASPLTWDKVEAEVSPVASALLIGLCSLDVLGV